MALNDDCQECVRLTQHYLDEVARLSSLGEVRIDLGTEGWRAAT
jgi:hypothetical protein